MMTDGQVKYQTLMENQRHNLAMESYNREQAEVAKREVTYRESKLPYEIKLLKAQEGEAVSKDYQAFAGVFGNVAKAMKDAVGAASGIGALFG